ncbi:MAG: hypothetical protein HQL69_21085 [Magnetococcales bacterium]|nr:hypothetical protein [Magnetococcales bacterium]
MRIFLQILLGAIAIIALFHGLRKLWQSRQGADKTNGYGQVANDYDDPQTPNVDFSDWIKSTNGRITIIVLSVSLLLMAVERVVSVGDKIPVDFTPVPTQTTTLNK